MTDKRPKNENAMALGKLGGEARNKALSSEQKRAIGRLGAEKRWKNRKKEN